MNICGTEEQPEPPGFPETHVVGRSSRVRVALPVPTLPLLWGCEQVGGLAGARAGRQQGRAPEQWRVPGWSGKGMRARGRLPSGRPSLTGGGGAERRPEGLKKAGQGAELPISHLPPYLPPSCLLRCSPTPVSVSEAPPSLSLCLLAVSPLKVSPVLFGNPCLSFLHLSVSLCPQLSDS